MAIGAIGPAPVPPGSSRCGPGRSSIPVGWLLCDGSAVSRTTYVTMFGVVRPTFGAGVAATTFACPRRNRCAVGAGATNTVGATGGEASHTLTAADIPSHTHAIPPRRCGRRRLWQSAGRYRLARGPTRRRGGTGGGGAHSHLPPYLGFALIIKT